jgi:hypothetical protein
VRALVAGWFSFELMGASAGDLLACDVVCGWLDRGGVPYDVALAPPFAGGVDWKTVDPHSYTDLIFVCGPIGDGPPVDELLARFTGRRLTGINLTMLHRLDEWQPFDLLWERDSSDRARPDVALLSTRPLASVVGTVLIDSQPEYGERDRSVDAHAAIERVLGARELAVVRIDTRLDEDGGALRSPAQVESLIARMDAVVTTRLHGTVLALKNGVPAVVIDSVAGGDKVSRQARALGWPALLLADGLDDSDVAAALEWCLSREARARADEVVRAAAGQLDEVEREFRAAFTRR